MKTFLLVAITLLVGFYVGFLIGSYGSDMVIAERDKDLAMQGKVISRLERIIDNQAGK